MGFRETMEQVVVKKEAGMGMCMRTPTVSMKLLIDTKGKRVLFAEAGKECVDFLFQILSLPVATIINLLGEEGIGGCWPNLYKSLKNLDYTYMVNGKEKDTFLKPAGQVPCTRVPLLALPGKGPPMIGKTFYSCGGKLCSSIYFSDDYATICPACRKPMIKRLRLMYVASPAVQSEFRGDGIVHGMATYMVMDDLEVKPMSKISTLTLLNDFNLKSLDDLKEKVVNLGMNEALKLLKASHQSNNVLTDVFC